MYTVEANLAYRASFELDRLRVPTDRRQTSWLFTSEGYELNHGLPETNTTSGQSGTRTPGHHISSVTSKSLCHAASSCWWPPTNLCGVFEAFYAQTLPFFLVLTVVSRAMYALYAIDVPASQNPLYNLCWRITKGNLELTQNCQVRVNGNLLASMK